MSQAQKGVRLKRPKHVESWLDRFGVARHYYRPTKTSPRIALPGLPYSPEFMAAYDAAKTGPRPLLPALAVEPDLASLPVRISDITLNVALALYYASANYRDELAEETRKYRRRMLDRFAREGTAPVRGERPLGELTNPALTRILDEYESRHVAQSMEKSLKHFFQFCKLRELVDTDPTAAVKVRPPKKTEGFYTWTEDDAATFHRAYPLGKRENLMFALMLNLGLRRQDLVRIGPEHIRTVAAPKTGKPERRVIMRLQKTQHSTAFTLNVPLAKLPELERALDAVGALPKEQHTFIATRHKHTPLSATTVSGWMRELCDKAGLPDCTSHGLRKLCSVRLANAGCTSKEIQAITGHASLRVLETYIKKADQAVATDVALDKLTVRTQSTRRAKLKVVA